MSGLCGALGVKWLVAGVVVGVSIAASAARGAFLFTTMRDESSPSAEQVYFGASADGKRWESLNGGKPVLVSDVGEKGVRDSFLLRSHDGGKFWIIGTDLWINRTRDWHRATHAGSRSIVVWESTDLVHWSSPWLAPVAPEDAGCTWAPEAIYDEETGDYLVYWASMTKSDNFRKQRIWAAHTKDFHTFEKPFVFVEKPGDVIDIDIARDGERYYRFIKEGKSIREAVGKKLSGPWQDVESYSAGVETNSEGPICFQLKPATEGEPAEWCLLLDNLRGSARGYEAFTSHDPGSGQFTPAKDFQFPYRFRHGSVLPITTEELNRVEAAYPVGEKSVSAANRTLIDYFQPIPVKGKLSRDAWGTPTVGPRDTENGLEDRELKEWCYWDGAVLQGRDGKWHMFASRWPERLGHGGWTSSVAVHAVSEDVLGPYRDEGRCWPENEGGKGHNVTALVMPDGRYAVTISETRPGEVFASKSPEGPWESLGRITVADRPKWRASNVTPVLRPDGQYMIVQRSGEIMLSKEITGPYVVQGDSIYRHVKGLTLENLEDPVAWYSGGLYHIVVNSWSQRKAFHLTSPNGVDHWTYRGLAYDPTTDFIRYSDGTVNHWNKIERPSVILRDGHVAYFTFAVIDVPKNEEKGRDRHGSKVIVVPFDGVGMDRDLAEVVKGEG
ncbi:MAG: hypothetical protein ACTHN5_13945 [Phycisphaerae bacterium]